MLVLSLFVATKVFFAVFPSFFLLPPHLPPLRHCPSIRGKSKKKKGSLTTICTSSHAAPQMTEAEESTVSTCDEPLCTPELRPSCVGLLPSWSHCEPTKPLPTTTTTDTDHQTSPSVGRKRSYTPSHMSGSCTHVAQVLWPLPSNRTFPLLAAFRETCICFFSRHSEKRQRFAGGPPSFNYVYSKLPPVKTAVQ